MPDENMTTNDPNYDNTTMDDSVRQDTGTTVSQVVAEERQPEQPYEHMTFANNDYTRVETYAKHLSQEDAHGRSYTPTAYPITDQHQTVRQPGMGPYGQAPAPRPPERKGPRTAAIALLAVVLLLVFGTGLFAGWQYGRTSTLPAQTTTEKKGLQSDNNGQVTIPSLTDNNIQTVREAVIASVQPAVVQITTDSGLGSGIVIDKRGYIVTNYHVVEKAKSLSVKFLDGSQKSATLVGTDATDDLAVLKITPTTSLTTANLGDSSTLKVGQEVLAIGNPLGNSNTVTQGIISALGRNVSEDSTATLPNTIQTDAPINPGNSGGALVDLTGKVIGMPTLVAINSEYNTPANGVGYAIPSNRVKFIAQQIINDGKVTHTGRAALNVTVQGINANVAQTNGLAVSQGVLVVQVTPGGSADKAGIQVNDVIVQVDGKAVTDASTLSDALLSKDVGQQVSLKIYRGNQQMTINVTLGELQAQNS
ncbi:S1C family serine protease [Ktedonospora formicarum]|uniref:PDZ domain-containing protein n=1 Tax=Ktedonospora formicarum TaxID=2778364 RepID=A0A8J3MQE8_9CHLR|nr:trypsin-like peptidase domain-containing protein [Ktedonospora formicarum]GHO44832.1 hypothetical protein KSX_29950 [Ktedonospora formicarum]